MIKNLEARDTQALAKPLAWVLRDTYGDFRTNVSHFKECKIYCLQFKVPYSESDANSIQSRVLFL